MTKQEIADNLVTSQMEDELSIVDVARQIATVMDEHGLVRNESRATKDGNIWEDLTPILIAARLAWRREQ